MVLQAVPAYLGVDSSGNQIEHPVELDRNLLENIFHRSGLTRPGDGLVTPVGGSMAVTVTPFGLILVGEENSAQGAYFAWNDSDEVIPWPNPGSQPRIDTLLARVVDHQYGTDPGQPRAEWDILQGAESSSPSAVTDSAINTTYRKPGAWVRFRDIRINPTDSQISLANITATVPYTNSLGSTPCLRTAHPASPFPGERIYEIDTGYAAQWDAVNSKWRYDRTQLNAVRRGDGTNLAIVSGTTPVAVNHMTFSQQCYGGYNYEFLIRVNYSSTSTSAGISFVLREGATDIDRKLVDAMVTTTTHSEIISAEYRCVTTGLKTFSLHVSRFTGSGTVTVNAGTSNIGAVWMKMFQNGLNVDVPS